MASDQEIEVKFYLADLPALQRRLEALGARCSQPRTYEVNLRFDSPGAGLSRTFQVLRLRQDTAARLTYKGAEQGNGEVHIRTEIEFEVSDFEAARRFLEALGYTVMMAYEKFRTVYELDGQEVTLDEMPYGSFSEIEGSGTEAIRQLAKTLSLDWQKRVVAGYVVLFDQLKRRLDLPFRDLTFANFEGRLPSPADLQVRPADQ